MISRLTLGAYDTVATMIQKTEPLVSFNKSCSQTSPRRKTTQQARHPYTASHDQSEDD